MRSAFIFFIFTILLLTTASTARNITIDDQQGDEVTGFQVIYYPNDRAWAQGSQCPGCALQPNPSLAMDGTWHDATWHGTESGGPWSFTLLFNGDYSSLFAHCDEAKS